jgi:hypothetical protein
MGYLSSRPASYYDDDGPDYDLEDERQEALFERRYQARLSRHPDCRAPDHPGCEGCSEGDA